MTSNTAQVVPNDESVFIVTNLPGGSRVVEFFGLDAGTSMIEARNASGEVVTYVQVQVADMGGKHGFIKLAQPSMALNAANSPVRYEMKYSSRVIAGTSTSDIIDSVSAKSHLRHLVFSCHGSGDSSQWPYLAIGSGFRTNEDASSSVPCTAW